MIYFVRAVDIDSPYFGHIKIGYSGMPSRRFSQLRKEAGVLHVLGITRGDRDAERNLHERFSLLRSNDLGREWFISSSSIMDYICENGNHVPRKMTIPLTYFERDYLYYHLYMACKARTKETGVKCSAVTIGQQTGISSTVVSYYLRGKIVHMDAAKMKAIADALGVDYAEVVYPGRNFGMGEITEWQIRKSISYSLWRRAIAKHDSKVA